MVNRIPFLIFVLSLSYCINTNAYGKRLLRIGVFSYPPLMALNKEKEASGILIEILKNKLSKEFELQFIPVPIARTYNLMLKGQLHTHLGMLQNEERSALFDFTHKSIFELRPYICGAEDVLKSENLNIAKFKNKTVVIPDSKLWRSYFKSKTSLKVIPITFTGDYSYRAISMYKYKRVDFAFLPYMEEQQANLKCLNLKDRSFKIFLPFKKGSQLLNAVDKLL